MSSNPMVLASNLISLSFFSVFFPSVFVWFAGMCLMMICACGSVVMCLCSNACSLSYLQSISTNVRIISALIARLAASQAAHAAAEL